jgi:hypothetical protein
VSSGSAAILSSRREPAFSRPRDPKRFKNLGAHKKTASNQ